MFLCTYVGVVLRVCLCVFVREYQREKERERECVLYQNSLNLLVIHIKYDCISLKKNPCELYSNSYHMKYNISEMIK